MLFVFQEIRDLNDLNFVKSKKSVINVQKELIVVSICIYVHISRINVVSRERNDSNFER